MKMKNWQAGVPGMAMRNDYEDGLVRLKDDEMVKAECSSQDRHGVKNDKICCIHIMMLVPL